MLLAVVTMFRWRFLAKNEKMRRLLIKNVLQRLRYQMLFHFWEDEEIKRSL